MQPDERKFIEIGLGEERYALPITSMQEIIRLVPLSAIPSNSPSLRGLLCLREATLPVFELRSLLNLPKAEDTKRSRIIILAEELGRVGLVVDSVEQAAVYETIYPVESVIAGGVSSAITGIASKDGELISLLDPGLLLHALRLR